MAIAALSSSVDVCSPLARPGIDENTIVGKTGALVLAVTSFVRFPKFSDRVGRPPLDVAAPETYFAPVPLPGFEGGRRRTTIDVARGIIALSSVNSISLNRALDSVVVVPSLVDSSYIERSKSVPFPSLFNIMISRFKSKTDIEGPSNTTREGSL